MARTDLQLRMELSRGSKLPEEASPWFWNPRLIGIQLGPDDFRAKLHEIDPDLEVTWNKWEERWQIWVKKPSTSKGWMLLFTVQDNSGNYVPLDERTLGKIYLISGDVWGNGKKYFDALIREATRKKEKAQADVDDESWQQSGEFYDYTLPKVGYGPISSSKVVGQ